MSWEIAIGMLALVYGGFSYTKETHETRIGPLELSVKDKETVDVPVWAGIGTIVVGGFLLLLPGRASHDGSDREDPVGEVRHDLRVGEEAPVEAAVVAEERDAERLAAAPRRLEPRPGSRRRGRRRSRLAFADPPRDVSSQRDALALRSLGGADWCLTAGGSERDRSKRLERNREGFSLRRRRRQKRIRGHYPAR